MKQSVRQINTHILPLTEENWLSTVQKPCNQRMKYAFTEGILHIGQFAARFLGLPLDEDEYYNRLYDLAHQDIPGIMLLSGEHLDHTIEGHLLQTLHRVLYLHWEQHLTVHRLTSVLDDEQLLLKASNQALHRRIREAFISTLTIFSQKEENGLQSPELQRVLVDVLKWSHNHLGTIIDQVKPEFSMLKCLWYGNARKSEQYFLSFLFYLGCDLLLFSPSGEDPLSMIDEEKQLTFVHHYPVTKNPAPFPTEKRNRKSTTAYRAAKEIEWILNHEGSHLYKPWQLRDYTPLSITLKTTYDELFLLAKEKAMIRPGFEVKNRKVRIPTLFAKVQGMSRNRKEYWERIHFLTEMDHCLLIKEFPFTRSFNHDLRFHYRNALGEDGELSTEKMLQGSYWKYRQLPLGLQNGMAAAIKNMCTKPRLKALHHEKEEEIKMYLFTQGLQIPSEILKMLQRFDYSQEVPKLILFNDGNSGILSRSDAAILLLLNQFGFDLILYNPAGQSDLENEVDDQLFDTHWLDDLVFEQEYKEPSPLRKFTLKGFWKSLRGGE